MISTWGDGRVSVAAMGVGGEMWILRRGIICLPNEDVILI